MSQATTLPPHLTVQTKDLTDTPAKAQLLSRIENHTAKIAIIGLGYVGLPLACCVAKVGFNVMGFDLNSKRATSINAGESYIDDVSNDELAPLVESGHIQAFDQPDCLAEADVIVICVPTPLTANREPDISYIQSSTELIAKYLRPGQLVSLESTTYPGTTEEAMKPILEATGLKVGVDFFLSHSPERVDPGNARYTTHNTNKVVGGSTPNCNEVATAFYKKIILNIITVSSPSCAEMVKVFENTFRAVNIALVNELAILADKMDLNVWEVLQAAGTKPFGIMSFYPGPGVGGHCIPIDPFYLTWKAREYNFHTRFIELAGEINSFMPQFVREKIMRALGFRNKPLRNSNVLILGTAYKRDLRDWRHSPALDLWKILDADGVHVHYNDPHVDCLVAPDGTPRESMALTPETLAAMDCVVLVTDHTAYDLAFIAEHSPIIVDTRNSFQDLADAYPHKIIRL